MAYTHSQDHIQAESYLGRELSRPERYLAIRNILMHWCIVLFLPSSEAMLAYLLGSAVTCSLPLRALCLYVILAVPSDTGTCKLPVHCHATTAQAVSLLLSLRHALPHAPDRAVFHFAVEVHARAVQDSEPLVPRLLAARHALHPRVPEQRALMESGVET